MYNAINAAEMAFPESYRNKRDDTEIVKRSKDLTYFAL